MRSLLTDLRADLLSAKAVPALSAGFTSGLGLLVAQIAFDPARKAILLVADDKSGINARRFYRALIRKADERFDRHLARLAKKGD